jgi:hypothetical protein
MLVGTACWVAFALVAVALEGGVIIDEAVVPGQIIAGLVKYPGGHPHDIFYKTVYSFQNVAAAWFLSLWNSDIALFAVRNWLFLSLSLVAPFAITLALTRRLSWAHVAAALTLFEGHLLYDGVYPMRVFPDFYSHGHVGLQLAVLAGALIVGRQWRTGGVLAGMIPSIHAGMTLALWPWVACYVFWLRRVDDRAAARRLLAGLGVGVVFSVVVAILIRFISDPFPPVSPYDALAGADAARAGFEAVSDTHRMIPTFVSLAYLLNPVAFLALSYVLLWSTYSCERSWKGRSLDAAAIVGLGLFSLAIVYGVWLMQIVFGELPELVSMAMPYRLSNVTATLLIPVSIAATAAIVRRMDEQHEWLARTVAALVVAALGVAMCGFVRLDFREAVLRQMLIVLWALPFGLGLWAFGSARGQRWHLLLPAGGTVLAAVALWSVTKSAVYLAAATLCCLAGAWLARRLVPRIALRVLRRMSSALMALAVLVCVFGVLTARGIDAARSERLGMISNDDLTIRRWLTENATPDELVLTPIWPRVDLQARARQPVLFETETLWLMTYMPSLAPRIGTMARDLYGVDYEGAGDYVQRCPNGLVTFWCDVWNDAWRTRTREQWIDLARKYRFRLVMASPEINIDLPVVLQTNRANMYEIPHGTEHPRD